MIIIKQNFNNNLSFAKVHLNTIIKYTIKNHKELECLLRTKEF